MRCRFIWKPEPETEPSYHGLLAALRWSREHPADRDIISARMRQLADGWPA